MGANGFTSAIQQRLDLGEEDHAATSQDLAGAGWLTLSADTTREEAREIFRAKYWQDPAEVRPGLGGLLLAGPIPAGRIR